MLQLSNSARKSLKYQDDFLPYSWLFFVSDFYGSDDIDEPCVQREDVILCTPLPPAEQQAQKRPWWEGVLQDLSAGSCFGTDVRNCS